MGMSAGTASCVLSSGFSFLSGSDSRLSVGAVRTSVVASSLEAASQASSSLMCGGDNGPTLFSSCVSGSSAKQLMGTRAGDPTLGSVSSLASGIGRAVHGLVSILGSSLVER
uniref:Uncharacterized protein n=1 Tax=Ixodes ricinus TaxID=34613 RepID=A0A6B0UK26_IXORI